MPNLTTGLHFYEYDIIKQRLIILIWNIGLMEFEPVQNHCLMFI